MTFDADVLVLGAGPAGCAAGIHARRMGLRVVMLETSASPKASPGETLHPGIEPLLKQLGVFEQVLSSGFPRHRGVWFQEERSGSRRFLPYGEDEDGPWLGFQADRRILQHILQQAAIEAGVELFKSVRPLEVLLKDGRVIGVKANDRCFQANWTLDATGHYAWLTKALALPVNIYSPSLTVRFGWRNETLPELEGQPLFAFREDGWVWQAQIEDHRTAWAELHIGESISSGIDVTWRICHGCAGSGFFLIGDAAAVLDPSSSHGVLRAIMSGMMASHLISSCRNKHLDEEHAISTYKAWLAEFFAHDMGHLRQTYIESSAGRRFIE